MNSQDPQYLPRGTRGDLVESQTGALAPYAPGYADEDDFESDFSLADIFTVLWERKWWILLAALLGLIAPLAYLSAARGWSAVAFPSPSWQGVAVLALGWAIALSTPRGTDMVVRLRIRQAFGRLSPNTVTSSTPTHGPAPPPAPNCNRPVRRP